MFGLFPSALFTTHQGQLGGRGLSPRLWAQARGQALSPDGQSNGFFVGEDFGSFGGTVTTNVGTYSGEAGSYKSYEDTGAAITQQAGLPGGVIKIVTAGTDNHEAWLQSGYSTGNLGKLSRTAGDNKTTIFETRFKVGQIGNTYNTFLGLTEEGLAAADTALDAGGAMADKDQIGFKVDETAGATLKFQYKKAGQTLNVPIASAKTLVADTFVKAGFVYNPSEVASRRIKIYVDNVESSTYVTDTMMAAADFPLDQFVSFLAGLKNGTASINSLFVDWWLFFQEG